MRITSDVSICRIGLPSKTSFFFSTIFIRKKEIDEFILAITVIYFKSFIYVCTINAMINRARLEVPFDCLDSTRYTRGVDGGNDLSR